VTTQPDGVVLCFDSAYVWPACVAIHSVAGTWAASRLLHLYCLTDSTLTDRHRAALDAVSRANGATLDIVELDVDLPQEVEFPYENADYVSPFALGRLWAPEIINADRLLYLDCDIVACADVSALLRPIGSDYVIAAARDVYGPEIDAPHIGPPRFPFGRRAPTFPFFNSGVLAIDVARWRDQKITGRAEAVIRDPARKAALNDQDTLNQVLDGRFEMLDPRWNVAPVTFIKKTLDVEHIPGEKYIPVEYQRDLEDSPWIVHYLTDLTPWRVDFGDDPLGRRWHAAAAEAAEVLTAAGVTPPTAWSSKGGQCRST
jgi:lipopolysaccharide biosynthesis glycosyltransferase